MKKFTLILIALTALFTVNLSAEDNCNCTWDSWFKYPQANKTYEEGKDVYVKIDVKNRHDIQYIELYVNGKFVRKENNYPYEWAKPNGGGDHYLRNMKAGNYKLKARIKDRCGRWHEIYCGFVVKCYNNQPTHCVNDAWFKYPKCGGTYQEGKDVYVRVDPKRYRDIAYMELYVNGKFVRKENNYPFEWAKPNAGGDHLLRRLKQGTYELTVVIVDKCGYKYKKHCKFYVKCNTPYPTHCNYDAWFKYPQSNQYYPYGRPVYVKVDVRNHQDVEYMELYVDGKFIRKENSYPYEWCKPNSNGDQYLRRLRPGHHTIKVRIKDKCGKWKEKHCKIFVRHSS